jgi:hypothetical protein
MSRFEIFIGTWNTSGEVLATESAPATTLTATDTYRWLPGNKFIVHEVDARFGRDVTRSMEVMGYDLAAKKFFARSFDDQGATELYDIDLTGKKWSIAGKAVRFTGRFDARGGRLTGLWEMKGTKAGWQPWIKLLLVRA